MPKKESAKEKAANKAQADAEARAKAAEDAAWADEDKGKAKKEGKKMDAEAKKVEEMQRKLERKRLEEEEMAVASKASKAPPKKVTQFEIQQTLSAPTAGKSKGKASKDEDEIDRNINHVIRESEEHLKSSGIERHVASGVDEAADLLKNLTASGSESPDAHPERRRKAAYKAYEDREIPKIREENPGLKLSQIKEIIFKNWQKSPENPMNEVAE